MKHVVGIDFGTTNSLVAWLDDGQPLIIPNDRGARKTPSVVSFTRKGELLVGESARNHALVEPERTIIAVKRMFGSEKNVVIDGRTISPEELASHIFKNLKRSAERHLGSEVSEAVVTVPARFSGIQRNGVRSAALMAGLEVRRLVNEPTAAAIARAYLERDPGGKRSILVYDFGGGTFDVTVLETEGRRCRVLATEGDERLGGIDIDTRLIKVICAEFLREKGVDLTKNPRAMQNLAFHVENAKIELSTADEAYVTIPFADANLHLERKINRHELEELIKPLVERTIALSRKALVEAGIEGGKVDRLVLSGGSSRIPLVSSMLARLIPRAPESRVNCDEIVAMGAAVEAAISEGRLSGFFVGDITTRSYGVETEGGSFVTLIPKHEALPTRCREIFTTVSDEQNSVEIHVLQGESSKARDNVTIGKFLLSGIRKAPRGDPRILVDFSIDESDLLRVRAIDMDTKVEQAVLLVGESTDGSQDSLALLVERVRSLATAREIDGAFASEIDAALEFAQTSLSSKTALSPDFPEDSLARERARQMLEAIAGELFARRRR